MLCIRGGDERCRPRQKSNKTRIRDSVWVIEEPLEVSGFTWYRSGKVSTILSHKSWGLRAPVMMMGGWEMVKYPHGHFLPTETFQSRWEWNEETARVREINVVEMTTHGDMWSGGGGNANYLKNWANLTETKSYHSESSFTTQLFITSQQTPRGNEWNEIGWVVPHRTQRKGLTLSAGENSQSGS